LYFFSEKAGRPELKRALSASFLSCAVKARW